MAGAWVGRGGQQGGHGCPSLLFWLILLQLPPGAHPCAQQPPALGPCPGSAGHQGGHTRPGSAGDVATGWGSAGAGGEEMAPGIINIISVVIAGQAGGTG